MSDLYENGENSRNENQGEYHYTQPENGRLYTDAAYVPQGESTVPPRYYVPPEKKAPAPKKEKGSHLWLKVACMCLVCALLGGIAGGALAGQSISKQLESAQSQSASTATANTQTVAASTTGTMTPAQIYEQACEQVVGIQSSITYMNFFGQTASAATSGSGFFISNDGYILTNYHVVEDAISSNSTINVLTHDGTSYTAKIVGTEESNDLAVLKIDATNTNAATFADSTKMSVGDTVYAVGNPMGELQFTMTSGMVSALDRAVTTSSYTSSINMFQFDAAINSGNSGGPVYNANGQVIGVATAKYSSSSSSSSASVEGLGFAIPSSDAQRIASDLMTVGHVTGKAYLGVSIDQNYTSVYSQYYNLPEGAYVKYVITGYCAEKAGLAAGDIITKLGDTDIKSYTDLQSALKQFRAGDETEVTVYRSGEYITMNVTLDEQPAETTSSASTDNQQSSSNSSQYGSYFGSMPSSGSSSYFFG